MLNANTVSSSSSSSSDGGGTVYHHSESSNGGPTYETTILADSDGIPQYQYQQVLDNDYYLGDYDNNDYGVYY